MRFATLGSMLGGLLAILSAQSPQAGPSIEREPLGRIGSSDISKYTLRSGRGVTVRIANYGGIVTSVGTLDLWSANISSALKITAISVLE